MPPGAAAACRPRPSGSTRPVARGRPSIRGATTGTRRRRTSSTATDRQPSGRTRPARRWVGAQDMAGNAMEWVSDWLAPYAAAPATDPTGPAEGTIKVEKGGWWGSNRVRRPVRLPPLRGSADLRRRAHRLPGGLAAVGRSATPVEAPASGRRVPRPGDPHRVGALAGGLPAARRRHRLAPAGRHEARREVGERRQHEQPLARRRDAGPRAGAPPWPDRSRRRASAPPAAARRASRGATEDQQVEVELARAPAPALPPAERRARGP